jgi:lipoprotein-releasing system ATP-binding protein
MSDAPAETTIEAIGVSKVYWDGSRRLEVLKGVDLSVCRGEGVAVWGPSGSGKTTFLNVLSGLDSPDAGRIRLAGTEMSSLGEKEKAAFRNRKIGFVFQFYHLLPEFTALENVMLPAMIAGKGPAARGRAESLLERVGLKERLGHFPSELSGGEQQRAAIARALVNDPEILFCDEPTGNLDARMGAGVAELLVELFRREKKTVLVVTHDERIAAKMDRVWSIVEGAWESRKPAGAESQSVERGKWA